MPKAELSVSAKNNEIQLGTLERMVWLICVSTPEEWCGSYITLARAQFAYLMSAIKIKNVLHRLMHKMI